jgi:hypothetical protein
MKGKREAFMQNIIEKIEKTLDVAVPFAILVLSVLQLTGAVEILDRISPVLYGALAAAAVVFKIWGIGSRRAFRKNADLPKSSGGGKRNA